MPTCAVFGCNNYSLNRKGTDGLKYYSFPKHDDFVHQWLQASRRQEKGNLKYDRNRSVHYKNECFFSHFLNIRYCNILIKGFRELKPVHYQC